jgi:hypothetical protein
LTVSDYSSAVYNRLLQTPQSGIIYFFFHHYDRPQTAESMIRALLRQILEKLDNIPEKVSSEYSQRKQGPSKNSPDLETYWSLLAYSIEEFFKMNKSRVFILVDAFDELLGPQKQQGRAVRERAAVASSLFDILKRTSCVKFLITTRQHHCQELQDMFPEAGIMEKWGSRDDMETFIKSQVEPFKFQTPLQDEIMGMLLQANLDDRWY